MFGHSPLRTIVFRFLSRLRPSGGLLAKETFAFLLQLAERAGPRQWPHSIWAKRGAFVLFSSFVR